MDTVDQLTEPTVCVGCRQARADVALKWTTPTGGATRCARCAGSLLAELFGADAAANGARPSSFMALAL